MPATKLSQPWKGKPELSKSLPSIEPSSHQQLSEGRLCGRARVAGKYRGKLRSCR